MRSSTRRWHWALGSRATPRSNWAFRPRALRLEDRCVPAVVSEFPLGTAPPAPQGITAGPDGALWYTDPGANKIGRITTAGAVTEYTLPTAASDPRGIALGPDGALWFTEFGSDRIGRISTTGVITEFTLAAGRGPTDIAVGADGALWFTESAADQIGRITVAGTVTEFVVPGVGSTPFGITAGVDSALWFTQFGSDQIGRITTAGAVTEFSAGFAAQPTGITTGSDGNLWFGSNAGAFVARITTGGTLSVFTGFGDTGATVPDIAAGPDGALWITEGAGAAIGRVNVTTGVVTDFATGVNPDGNPTSITAGPDGALWFTEPDAPGLAQITTSGIVSEFQLRASSGPADITSLGGTTGSLWFTEAGADKIGRIAAVSNAIIEYYLPNPTSDPRGIVAGPDGALWFTQFGRDRIGRIDPVTGAITESITGITVGAAPTDIVVGPDGALWFTEAGTDQIGRITTAGIVTEFVVPGTGSTPTGIVVGADNALWFTEFGSDQIGRITTAGTVTEFAVPGAGSGPLDIAAGSDGALWFTENTSNEIGRISTAGAVTEITVPTANAGPTGITAGSDGALWFTEATAGQVGRITTTGAITEISAGVNPDGGLAGIAFGPDRNLWFTEATAAQIGRVALSADLAVTKTDGMATVAPGTIVTYTIVVSSAAASDPVERVTVSDSFSAALTLVSWTAMFAGGASGTPSGNGNILEVVKLPAGGTVTYTVVGTVSAAAFGSLVNTVSLLPSVPDPNPANNSATDTDTITVQAIVTGTGPGGGPHVKAFNAQTGALLRSFFAYDSTFAGGVRVAFGDVNGDGVPDIITSPGAGGGPHVKAFDGFSGALIASFFAYDATFTGGVFVAAGDVNGDGRADIITGAGAGGGPHVKAFSGTTGALLASFFAYDTGFGGGVSVAGGNVNGDTRADIITGAGPGGGPHVRAFDATTGALLANFFAFDSVFGAGITVAAGDINADGRSDIIVGAGPGGLPLVRVFTAAGAVLASLVAYDMSFAGGVRVAARDLAGDGRADIITGAGPGGGPHVRAFDGVTRAPFLSFFAYDPSFIGGVFVG